MKEAYWGYWLVVLGIFIIVVLLLIQNFTSTNTQDFYLVKEITEAAMEDAVDMGYYREYGEAKINKEKFYESFIRRFAEEASITTTYDIEFTEVYEAPPKVGVKVSSRSNTFTIVGDSDSFDIVNKIDAILEASTKDVVSTSSTTTTTTVVEVAGTYTDYDTLINSDPSLENRFLYKVCTYYNMGTEYKLAVYTCGYPTTGPGGGVEFREFDPDTQYCIGYDINDHTKIVEGTFAMYEDLLNSGKCSYY